MYLKHVSLCGFAIRHLMSHGTSIWITVEDPAAALETFTVEFFLYMLSYNMKKTISSSCSFLLFLLLLWNEYSLDMWHFNLGLYICVKLICDIYLCIPVQYSLIWKTLFVLLRQMRVLSHIGFQGVTFSCYCTDILTLKREPDSFEYAR